MIEMYTTSPTLGALTFTDDGNSTDKNYYVSGGYAYKISELVQLGVQGNYSRFDSSVNTKTYGAVVGGIFNFDSDLRNAAYISLYGGMSWRYSKDASGKKNSSEAWLGRISLGKRFALSKINLPSVTYSPEISYTRSEFTKTGYGSNTISFRFLQFSAFF